MVFVVLTRLYEGTDQQLTFWQLYKNPNSRTLMFFSVLYSAIYGGCLSLIYYKRTSEEKLKTILSNQKVTELKLSLSDLQMKSLRAQLEPHFLFNALNSISALVRTKEQQLALTAIGRLSNLLRHAVESGRHDFISIDDELEFVMDYLSLQELRFNEKLKYQIQDLRVTKNQDCPPFILQTFVENAIKHNIESTGDAIFIRIEIEEDEHYLHISVENPLYQKDSFSGPTGIGLQNLKERLELLYDDEAKFSTRQKGGRFQVFLSLPKEPSR